MIHNIPKKGMGFECILISQPLDSTKVISLKSNSRMNNIASLQQSTSSISLNVLFDSKLMAIATIAPSGCLLHMNKLFSKFTCIHEDSSDINLFNYTLFDHPSFKKQLESLFNNEINEFGFRRFVEFEADNKRFVNLKAFRVDTDHPEKGAVIILEESSNQCSIEEVIQIIGNSLEKSKDDYFFDTMSLSLSKSLGIGMVFIGKYIKAENRIQSISFWNKDSYVSELSYPVKGSPTEVVMNTNTIRFYQENIQLHFPNDSSLKDWDVNSYVGCPLLNSDGEFVGYIGIMDSKPIRNIPLAQSVLHIYSHSLGRELERMTQKQKIENGELRYKAIYDQSPFGVIVSSRNGKLTKVNPRFCEMLGYTKAELAQLTRQDITHPDDVNPHINYLDENKFQQENQTTFKKRYIKKNNEICYAKVNVSNIVQSDKDYIERFVLVEDITDKIDREKQLRDNQKLTKNIIETAQDAVITFNHNDKVIEWNKQAEVMFGYIKDEAKQMSFSQFIDIKFDDNNRQTLKQFVKKYKQQMTIERMEVNARGKNGRIFPAEISLSPIKVNDFYVYSTFIRDITTRKKYQNILNQNLKELNQKNSQLQKYIDSNLQLENFAHIASHDLREPLRSIGNFSQLLNKRLENKLDKTEQEFFNFILTGVKNMSQLIEDLLMYSSINNQKTKSKELNLNDLLFVVSRNLHKAIQENKVDLIINKLPESFCSSDTKMKQLFQNLIANAIKFKKPDINPRIVVSCIDAGDYWQFKIEDNGIGIKEEFKEKIFMIFKKLHAKSEYQGTGIGLAVCKTIVDQHHGEIWVDSEFGVGTTFNFTLLKKAKC